MHFTKILLFCAILSSLLMSESISIEILDATIKDKKISNANVLLQQSGEQSAKAITDSNGKALLNSKKPVDSSTLLIIKKEGFSDLVVKCPCDGLTYAMSPVMKNLDGMRIVLNWGAQPTDLDSHLVFKDNHISFNEKTGQDAMLDVDDRDGYGPETITISKKQFGESYVYAIQDFINEKHPNTNQLSLSNAKIFVYVGQSLVKTYEVPKNKKGNIWTVFRLNPNGDFEDINTIGSITDIAQVEEYLSAFLSDSKIVALSHNPSYAKELNKLGEKAYRSGDFEIAIDYYQQAIDNDGVFSQAYSNLGLAYQKLNRVAEAVWANRKAIALASGSNTNTIKASSYYNIARIYEQNGDFTEALRHYKLAKQHKANPTYDKAIERIESKL